MSEKPLVSIAIPAFKAKYLAEAIESVLGQTYKIFELIIVNDASPEPLFKIVNRYDDKRIRYYANENNIGGKDPVANWNKCLSYAQGEFFALLCDDDVYESTFIEEMLKLSVRFKSCNVFKSGVQVIDAERNIITTYPESPEWESCEDYIQYVSERKRKQTISEWMFRRSHILSCGGYEPVSLAWGADYLSIIKFSVNGGIAHTKKNLVTFRRSGINLSTYGKNIEAKLLGIKTYTNKLDIIVDKDFNGNYRLHSYVDKIRNNCQQELLRVSSFKTICKIYNNSDVYDIRKNTLCFRFVKNIIRKILY